MNWVVASLIMFVSSVVLYLLVRKSTLLGNPTQINNLAMFSIPLVVYTVAGIITHANFLLTPLQYLIILVAAFFFSYAGNVFSLKGIEYAPNPGYSLVLSKSYVVFTTLVAVLFLHGQLTLLKGVAIAIIVAFSGLIMVGKATNTKVNKLWLPFSFGAFFCWGMLSLTSKYMLSQQVNIFSFLSYAYFFVTASITIEATKKKVNFGLIKKFPWIFLGIGLLSSSFNLCMFYAIGIAPNVGYVNAINAASISMVTIFSALLFKDELTPRKLLGVAGVTGGLILLLLK